MGQSFLLQILLVAYQGAISLFPPCYQNPNFGCPSLRGCVLYRNLDSTQPRRVNLHWCRSIVVALSCLGIVEAWVECANSGQ